MFTTISTWIGRSEPWVVAIVVKTSFLLLLSLAANQILRKRSAALRHFIYSLAMVGALILPLAAWMLPELRLAVLPRQPEWSSSSIPLTAPSPEMREASSRALIAPKSPTSQRSSVKKLTAPTTIDRSVSSQDAQAGALPKPHPFATANGSDFHWSESASVQIAVLLWLAGVAILFVRLVFSRLRLRALLRRAQAVDSIHMTARLRWLCRDLGIKREVVLLASSEIDVPIAAGVFNPRIVLSPQSAEWNDTRREAVLSHELAHLKRLDGFTQLLAELACAIYWFNPVVWLSARGMRFERERACDDYVLSFGTAASDYAHELLEIVSTLRRPQPAAALAMARRSQLEGRVLAMLDPRVPHRAMSRGMAFLMTAAIIVITLPLAAATLAERPAQPAENAQHQAVVPAMAESGAQQRTVARVREAQTDRDSQAPVVAPAEPAGPIEPGDPPDPPSPAVKTGNFIFTNTGDVTAPFGCISGSHVHSSITGHTDDNGYRDWTGSWTSSDCSIDARMIGNVRFNAEATTIESISPGGYFEVNERKGDNLRRARVEPGANGQLTYTYKVNGAQHDFDADARTWFSSFLLGMERTTGFAAETRVPALLAKGGPQAVLDEISHLQSDYVRQIYFTKLFEKATLPGPMLVKALDEARSSIGTDYNLAQVLLTIAQRYDLNDEAQRTAFLNAANKLSTDYEHSRVLLELLKRPNLSPQILHAALQSAKTIRTDYEKGRILVTLAGLSTFDEKEISDYLDLAGAINTDYERSRSLMALMEHQKLSPAAVSKVLHTASGIGTDYEKSRILLAVSESHNFDESQIGTYLTLVDSIGTDYERSRDLIALMQQHKLAGDSVSRIVAETAKIGTDYEKARVLTEVAGRYDVTGPLRDAYIKAADSIGTDYDRNRTLAAIAKRQMM